MIGYNMYLDREILEKKKFLLLQKILDNSVNKKFFNCLDTLILEKYFDNAYEYSLNENIESIYKQDLPACIITNIIENFFSEVENKTFYSQRSIYELVKISNFPSKKINKIISCETYLKIANYLRYVSHETNLISFDFLILRITDNLLFQLAQKEDVSFENIYIQLKKSIFEKMFTFTYLPEKKDKETTFLCWIDRLTKAIVDGEITLQYFICILRKMLTLINQTFDIYWKIVNSLDYLLLSKEFIHACELKKFKTEIEKYIEKKYTCYDISIINVQDIFVSILAKQQILKEDYSYLFDMLSAVSRKSDKNKFFTLRLCQYMLYCNQKKHIFHYRFIRKYFIDTVLSLFNHHDAVAVKDEEMQLLIKLWYTDEFFCFEKSRLLFNFVSILKSINSEDTKLSHNNFYKYCDVLDYIIATNPDLPKDKIVDFLARDNMNKGKLKKHFSLIFL